MNLDELSELVNSKMNTIPEEKVFYTLKQLRFRYLKPETTKIVRLCLALHSLKIPITTNTITYFQKINENNALANLHRLGDKHVLILHRGSKQEKRFFWSMSDIFMKLFS